MKPQILIAEDDLALQDLFTRVLRTAGYEVKAAQHGDAVMLFLEEALPDVLLLDLGLPGVTGVEILRQVRERAYNLHIIVITGNHYMEESLETELVDLFLLKPVGISELLQMVDRFAKGTGALLPKVSDAPPSQSITA